MNDKFHIFGDQIEKWTCTKCGYTGHNALVIQFEVTAGRFGPNGNGWNYWHYDINKPNNCRGRMNPIVKKATPART